MVKNTIKRENICVDDTHPEKKLNDISENNIIVDIKRNQPCVRSYLGMVGLSEIFKENLIPQPRDFMLVLLLELL